MKYALESLPELIGEVEYRNLCIALDMPGRKVSGQELAETVHSRVCSYVRREVARSQALQSKLDGGIVGRAMNLAIHNKVTGVADHGLSAGEA